VTPASDIRDVRLCLLGFGHVAQRFCEILSDRSSLLQDRHGVRILITAVGTGSHGSFTDPIGVPAGELLERYHEGVVGFESEGIPAERLISESGSDVLIESTPLEHGGTTAIAHLEQAFDHGLDVITVNKGPIAWAYQRMKAYAHLRSRRLRFEGVTMDGCPVYNLAEFCLPGDRVIGFRGVLNSTTNYVLDAMAEGASLDEALNEAKSEGIAETDPSYDVDGHDAAAKVAALANVLLDADITPDAVRRDSIGSLTPDDVAKVISYGRRLRVICSATVDEDDHITAGATLEPLRSDDPMYWISGTSSALVLETELAGTVEIVERDGLLTQTAYAIYADLLTLYGRT
jgi:homoserine dehydrogenase